MDKKKQFAFKVPRENVFPSRLIVELTNQCNLSCVMCPRNYTRMKKGFLSFDLFKKIINEMSGHRGVGLVPFFRGESLLHPRFITMMQYAKSRGIKPIQLATNGVLLSRDIADAILDVGLDFISFSLDSADREIYGTVRSGSEYDTVIKNIGYLLDQRKSRRLRLPEVQVSMVETPQTRKAKRRFIAYWRKKVERVRVYKEHSAGGIFGKVGAQIPSRSGVRKPCLKLVNEMAVYYNGDVAICNHDWKRRDRIGTIGKKSIADIWHSDAYQRLRRQHAEGRIAAGTVCSGCDQWMEYYLPAKKIGALYTQARYRA